MVPPGHLSFSELLGSGVGTIIKLGGGGGGRRAATRKRPTVKFKFLLGFLPLKFQNTVFKQKYFLNILKSIFQSKLRGHCPPLSKLEGQLPPLPPVLKPMLLGALVPARHLPAS